VEVRFWLAGVESGRCAQGDSVKAIFSHVLPQQRSATQNKGAGWFSGASVSHGNKNQPERVLVPVELVLPPIMPWNLSLVDKVNNRLALALITDLS
jgi:hypothetical protein